LQTLLKGEWNKYVLSAEALGDKNILAFAKQGFRHLHGISLEQEIYNMPDHTWIKYSVNNMYDTHYPDGMFNVVYNLNPRVDTGSFVNEAQRILSNNGLLVLHKKARMHPIFKDMQPIRVGKTIKVYQISKAEGRLPRQVSIICRNLGKKEGTVYTTQRMAKRLEECGIKVGLYKRYADAPKNSIKIVEWALGLKTPIPKDPNAIIQAHELLRETNDIGFSWQRLVRDRGYIPWLMFYALGMVKPHEGTIGKVNAKLKGHTLITFTYELAKEAGFRDFVIAPHIVPAPAKDITKRWAKLEKNQPLHIGSQGFAAWYKNNDAFCELAKRLGVKATLLLSVNHNTPESIVETEHFIRQIRNKYGYLQNLTIKVGAWTDGELAEELDSCTHLISPQVPVRNVSSSMRFFASLGKPIISPDHFQSREAQVIRRDLRDVDGEFLENTRYTITNMDDGLHYMLAILKAHNKLRGAVQW